MSWFDVDDGKAETQKPAATGPGPGPGAVSEPAKSVIVEETARWLNHQNEVPDGRSIGLHVSELARLCPREIALRHVFPKKGEKNIDPKLRYRFDIGHAWHEWLQNRYWGPMKRLHGSWKCLGCGAIAVECVMPDPHSCAKPWASWDFIEIGVSYTEVGWELPIVGSSDGELVEAGDLMTVEIKTWSKDALLKLKEPVAEHIYQASLYAALRKRRRAVIVYADPSGLFNGPAKIPMLEFPFTVSPDVLNNAIGRAREVNQLIVDLRAKKLERWPERICRTIGEYRAKDCAWRQECFQDYTMVKILESWHEKNKLQVEPAKEA